MEKPVIVSPEVTRAFQKARTFVKEMQIILRSPAPRDGELHIEVLKNREFREDAKIIDFSLPPGAFSLESGPADSGTQDTSDVSDDAQPSPKENENDN